MQRATIAKVALWMVGVGVTTALGYLTTVWATTTTAPPVWPFFLCAGLVVTGLIVWLIARRDSSSEVAPRPPTRGRIGLINKPGGVARLHRPKYGKGLDVGVENEGDLEQFDPEHE